MLISRLSRSQQVGSRLSRDKVRPTLPLQWYFREKIRPARQKPLILGCFERAGRFFSRSGVHPCRAGRVLYRLGAGVEGAVRTGGPGCGARGRWRGLAGLRDDAQSHTSATRHHWCGGRRRVRRAWLRRPWAVAGPGRASRRRAERSSRRGRRAGGPPPTGTQSSPAHRTARVAPATPVGPQATLRNWEASRPTARSARRAILQSPGRPRCRRRNAPRALPGRNR